MSPVPIPSPTASLLASLEVLGELDMAALSGGEQADLLRELGRAEAKMCAVKMRLLSAAAKSGAARACGAADAGQWAARLTNADQAVAHRQLGLAAGLVERTVTAKALADGILSAQHAEVIVQATGRLPDTVTAAGRAKVEADLVAKATVLPPQALRRAARRALAAIESDQVKVDAHENQLVADEEAAAWATTRMTLHDNADGTVTGHFTVPTFQGHLLRKVLEAITAPRRGRLGAAAAQVGPHEDRTDWNRARGQAFCELIEHLPTTHLHPKTAATIVVTIEEEQLRDRLKAADLDTGEKISAGQARRVACNAGILPAVLAGLSVVLDLGRLRRLFSQAQRIALGLIHHTCAADGCERPFAWCGYTTEDHGAKAGPPTCKTPSRCVTSTTDASMTPATTIASCPTAASHSAGGREISQPRPSPAREARGRRRRGPHGRIAWRRGWQARSRARHRDGRAARRSRAGQGRCKRVW
jgi:hypothetical protein